MALDRLQMALEFAIQGTPTEKLESEIKGATKAAEKLNYLIDDVETLQARQQLNQIASNSANLQRLTAFCIKHEVTPPVRINDITACRQSALKYYSLPTDETKLKETAARPLKDQLYFSKEIKPYLDKVNQE